MVHALAEGVIRSRAQEGALEVDRLSNWTPIVHGGGAIEQIA
jgi:hypothetical protein